MITHRLEAAKHEACVMEIRGKKARAAITGAKRLILTAVCNVIKELEPYWPLSDRQIHYALLNNPPLKHASKPGSTYRNDTSSYKALTDLLTRARLERHIPWHVIGDETRPVWEGVIDSGPSTFIQRQLDGFLKNYWRNLMSSQPSHIEIIGEKNTILGIIRPVAFEYCVPLTIGRGYCSLDPRRRIAERFRKSGKSKLILLILSDFDPDGQEIAHSLARSLRDDFGIENIDPVKVALTAEQVKEMGLPPILAAKESSSSFSRFVGEHGHNVFELESVPPDKLQAILRAAIDQVIDKDRFNAELDAEKSDAAFLARVRRAVIKFLETLPELAGGKS